jgi:hypothetical protein
LEDVEGPEPIMGHRLLARAARRSLFVGILCAGAVGSGLLAFAGDALAAPAWRIELTHRNPYGQLGGVDPYSGSGESFARESGYNAYTVYVGNAGTSEVAEGAKVTVADQLPEGLVLAAPPGLLASGEGWSCRIESFGGAKGEYQPRATTCTRLAPTRLPVLATGRRCTEQPRPPGCYPPLTLHVEVLAQAADWVSDAASVYGGEANPPSAAISGAEGRTQIAPAVGFGIACFSIEVLLAAGREGECGSETGTVEHPFTQAGGRPFAITTKMAFNYTTNFEGKLVGAGGGADQFGVGPKEVETSLPPGLLGYPSNAPTCPLPMLGEADRECPNAAVGYIHFNYTTGSIGEGGKPELGSPETSLIYNVAPPPGHPAAFGFIAHAGDNPFLLFPRLRSDEDYGVTVGDTAAGPLRAATVTFCGYGAESEGPPEDVKPRCRERPRAGTQPFLVDPTQCTSAASPAPMTLLASSPYPSGDPAGEGLARMATHLNAPSAPPTFLEPLASEAEPVTGPLAEGTSSSITGCSGLAFAPQIEVKPSSSSEAPAAEAGTVVADSPSAVTVALNNEASAANPGPNPPCTESFLRIVICRPITPALKSLRLSLPPGLTVSPPGAEGLQACTNQQFGLETEFGTPRHPLPSGARPTEPADEAHCPLASQIGTVEVFTPLLAEEPPGSAPLHGALYAAQPECSPCSAEDVQDGRLLRLFLELQDRHAGVVVRLEGFASINQATGRLETTFEDQPQTPFSKLVVHLKGGPRATLATPQSCGVAQTESDLTPWSAPIMPDATPVSAFAVEGCAANFSPSLTAGSEYPAAGQYTGFSLTLGRDDREGNPEDLEVRLPPGLTARISGVPLCAQAQASAGTCAPESQIGTVTAGVGSGPHPYVQQGEVYLTGPLASYPGDPFGLSIVIPAVAGPYNLGRVLVTSGIAIDPHSSAITVATDHLPQSIDGVPLRLKAINVQIDRERFARNPTSCAAQAVGSLLSSTAGQLAGPSSPFHLGGCGALSFKPVFTAQTQARTSREEGAALTVRVAQGEGEADIRRTDVQLPEALPSRMPTLQQACTEHQFAADPAGCPAGSFVGHAVAHTPLLSLPLEGPAILVSHGGVQFPDLELLLEGEGVKIDLVGNTDIKHGITYSRFETIPDQPISSFELALPRGPHSLLAANGNLCTEKLQMPTTIEAQDGAQVTQTTRVEVSGCPRAHRLTRVQRLKRALNACRKQDHHRKRRRRSCEKRARRRARRRSARSARASKHRRASRHLLSHAMGGVAREAAMVLRSAALAFATGGATPARATGNAVAPSAGGPCPNEALRAQSNIDPATGRPYSEGLPECRAYEMVSPVDTQGHGVAELAAVAPSGEAVGFTSEGGFADPQNFYLEGPVVRNSYVARRELTSAGAPEWTTESAFAPAGLVELPNLGATLALDLPASLEGPGVGCGVAPSGGFTCARGTAGSAWTSTPVYMPAQGLSTIERSVDADLGQSADLSRVYLEPGEPLLPQDRIATGGLYELSGIGTANPRLRLVNVDNEGRELGFPLAGSGSETPLLGDGGYRSFGTAWHAVAEDGHAAFFTATPPGGQQTVYARVSDAETLALSAPEDCRAGEERCEAAAARPATFQGASADGKLVFFTTEQALLPEDRDHSTDLYEYDFAAPAGARLRLLSRGAQGDPSPGEGARVQGVVRSSPDGSRVYFVAEGVLTTLPNGLGAVPRSGAFNLYAVDTGSGALSFVATLPSRDEALWGRGCKQKAQGIACDTGGHEGRRAQVTPDGRYLVFDSHARLLPEVRNGCRGAVEGGVEVCEAQAVYRYDAADGQLVWISRPAPGTAQRDEGKSSLIEALDGSRNGAMADFEDAGRAISANGQYVVFTSEERLQQDAPGGSTQAYLWHCAAPCPAPAAEGTVSMVSGGGSAVGAVAVSSSAQDVFLSTATALVPQDAANAENAVRTLYDARIDGGIAPETPAVCTGEACQGEAALLPAFGLPGSVRYAP